ncbi:hypothetical protein [Cellulosimicrobium sp. Marseille-Q4280]|uniref:hypothetical protein n=1 Tax=Cellulosimicrobium sp. Marseille-Q4280 TaxID=2937992 RepID=UPI0020402DE4|nr:hypothetical protein [Cellulosimicrobium sp. Marseille-Q4280]
MTTQYPRYKFLLNPGEQLQTAAPAFSIAEAVDGDLQVMSGALDTYAVLEGRRLAFLTATGLVEDEVIASPLLTMPFPICGDLGPAPLAGQYDTRRRFPHVSAEALRNPLFWLPPSLYERQVRPEPTGADNDPWAAPDPRSTDPLAPAQFELDEDSGLWVETDDAWALRVALVLTESGLYHPGAAVRDEQGNLVLDSAGMPILDPGDENAGTWLDVLAMVDLDPADVADAERIAAWLDGAFDPDLDTIDLEPLLATSDPSWALDVVHAMWELNWRTAWGRIGSDMTDEWSWLALLGDLVAGQGDLSDPDKANDLARLAAMTVADMADELPDDGEMDYLTGVMAKVLTGTQPDAEESARMSAALTPAWGGDLPRALAALATTETSRLLRHARAAFEAGYDTIEAELAETTLDPAEDMAYVLQVEQIARVKSRQADEQVTQLAQALPAGASHEAVYAMIGDLLVGPFSDARTLVMVAATTYRPAVDFYDEQIPAA